MAHRIDVAQVAARPIVVLALLALLAGCTSSPNAGPRTAGDGCGGKPPGWCVGYRGNN